MKFSDWFKDDQQTSERGRPSREQPLAALPDPEDAPPAPTTTVAPEPVQPAPPQSEAGLDIEDGHGADLPGGGSEAGNHGGFDDPLYYFNHTPKIGSAETPGRVTPDKKFEMQVYGRDLMMPDGTEVEFWGFEDRENEAEVEPILPGSPIRVTEGDIVHVTIKPAKRQHTLHLHGIEIDTHNDGVGHTSFEVTGEYTYQFRAGAPFRALDDPTPQTRGAGTYLYHCHVNTPLHFQMGMYGPLIIDPIEGPGTAFHNGPTYDVAAERYWAVGEVDPSWRELGHQAGLKGGDAGLNDFNPKYFHISGQFQPLAAAFAGGEPVIDSPLVATEGVVGGEPILIRYANASYCVHTIDFEGTRDGSLDVQVIASDGRPFDNLAPNFAQPFALNDRMIAAAAERYDFLVTPLRAGTSKVRITYRNWITNAVMGEVVTTVTGV